jgi:hypothetical protein
VNRVRLAAAAACALLFVAGCDADAVTGSGPQVDSLRASSSGAPARPASPSSTRLANQRLFANGLSATVSAPKSFTPTDAALPRSPRAIAFDLIIENGSGTVYRPAQLSILATVDDKAAPQIVDSTQGYTGFVGAVDEVAPGQSVRVTVAFAVPAARAHLQLTVQPDAVDSQRLTVFEGTV